MVSYMANKEANMNTATTIKEYFINHTGQPGQHNTIHCHEHIPNELATAWAARPRTRRFHQWYRLEAKHIEAQRGMRERLGGGDICDECRTSTK